MVDNVKVIQKRYFSDFEHELKTEIRENGAKIKDIKFCVNPIIEKSYSNYEKYYAMIIFGGVINYVG